jgi:hypothetical protein
MPGLDRSIVEHRLPIKPGFKPYKQLSGIHPRYSCKEGRRVEDELLLEFPCTPTRTRSM